MPLLGLPRDVQRKPWDFPWLLSDPRPYFSGRVGGVFFWRINQVAGDRACGHGTGWGPRWIAPS